MLHQRHAIILFNQGNINDAVYHSYRARLFAFNEIINNGGTINDALLINNEELIINCEGELLDSIIFETYPGFKNEVSLEPGLQGVDL